MLTLLTLARAIAARGTRRVRPGEAVQANVLLLHPSTGVSAVCPPEPKAAGSNRAGRTNLPKTLATFVASVGVRRERGRRREGAATRYEQVPITRLISLTENDGAVRSIGLAAWASTGPVAGAGGGDSMRRTIASTRWPTCALMASSFIPCALTPDAGRSK